MIEASGLPRIRPLQDLRHTHATLLLADGENAKVVQERLGHHSHSFTADTYQHVMPGMDAAAASRSTASCLAAAMTRKTGRTRWPELNARHSWALRKLGLGLGCSPDVPRSTLPSQRTLHLAAGQR